MSNFTTAIPPTTNSTELSPPSKLLGVWMFVLVCLFVLAVATAIVNGLTLYAIYKDPLKCFRNPLAIFLTGVITADFLTGLVGEPIMLSGIAHLWVAETKEEERTGHFVSFIGFVVTAITITVSFLNLLALAISQLLAIGWPNRYQRSVDVLKAKLGVALIWVFTIIACIALALVSYIFVLGTLILEVGIMTIALVVLYLVSFHVFRSRVGRHDTGENELVNKEFLRGTFLLVLVNIIAIWPYIVLSIATILVYGQGNLYINLEIARSIFSVLFHAKFLVDPLILVWRLDKYRKAMKIVYASCLTRCGCTGESAAEAKAVYAETPQEDFNDNSQEDKVNVETI